MNNISKLMRLYLVTDPYYKTKAPTEILVEQALKGGVTLVQLREKDLDFTAFLQKAKRVKKVCEQYSVPLIINDNIEVALQSGADGLHIGQGDMSARAARKLLGEGKILGVSASTVQEAERAREDGADYLGIGAVFATDTKTDADVVAIDTIQEITKTVPLPSCAIGGLKAHNLDVLKGTGVNGIAVVSAILGQSDITKASRQLLQQVQRIL